MNGCLSLFESALAWSNAAVYLAIYAGASAGLLAIVVLAINVLFRRWLSARQMGLLWGIVLIRLLVPMAPASSWSLQNLLPSTETQTFQDVTVLNDGSVALTESLDAAARAADSGNHYVISSVSRVPSAREIVEFASDDSLLFVDDPLFAILRLVGFAGGAASLLWTAIVCWRLNRSLQHVPACQDQRLGSLWDDCRKQAGVRRCIPILLFDGVPQPAVLGLFRPRLLLPAEARGLNDLQLRMVMLHELAHVRQWDVAANWLLVAIRAIHWWNPVYWLAAARFQSLREQSCDAFAIRRIEGQPARSYGELLLSLAQHRPSGLPWNVSLPASLLGFVSSFFRKHAIGNRLKALRSAGMVRSRRQTAGVIGLSALVAVCGLTDANQPARIPAQTLRLEATPFEIPNEVGADGRVGVTFNIPPDHASVTSAQQK